jgi:hypothetical protein
MVEQMMKTRRFIAIAGCVAFVVSLAIPGGPACAWTGDGTHGCCAVPAVETDVDPSGCCDQPDPSPAPEPSGGCDCVHAPSAPTAVTVGTPTVNADSATTAYSDESSALTQIESTEQSTVHVPSGRNHPPPIFLLDCAFLT